MWDPLEILERCIAALRTHAEQLDGEQQPKGLDALDEIEIQAVLAGGLSGGGRTVLREQHYPSLRRAGARSSQRERCDLVMLPAGAATLGGPGPDASPAALFSPGDPIAGRSAGPEEAFWLEVKVVGQFAYRRGVPGPNHRYSTLLIDALRNDLQKLDDDAQIRAGGVLDVIFTAGERIAEHDMGIALQRSVDRRIVMEMPVHGAFEFADRIGNSTCSVWLTPVRRA